MSDLSEKKCIPCEGGIPAFDISEIHKYLKKIKVDDIKVIVGGIVPDQDLASLKKQGVAAIFKPGT